MSNEKAQGLHFTDDETSFLFSTLMLKRMSQSSHNTPNDIEMIDQIIKKLYQK
jgi:hypothetical protein